MIGGDLEHSIGRTAELGASKGSTVKLAGREPVSRAGVLRFEQPQIIALIGIVIARIISRDLNSLRVSHST